METHYSIQKVLKLKYSKLCILLYLCFVCVNTNNSSMEKMVNGLCVPLLGFLMFVGSTNALHCYTCSTRTNSTQLNSTWTSLCADEFVAGALTKTCLTGEVCFKESKKFNVYITGKFVKTNILFFHLLNWL